MHIVFTFQLFIFHETIIFMDYWWTMNKFWYFILKRGLKGTQIQKFCTFYYLTLEIVKQDKCPKYSGSSILQCPAIYCVKWNTVSTLGWHSSHYHALLCVALYWLFFVLAIKLCLGVAFCTCYRKRGIYIYLCNQFP